MKVFFTHFAQAEDGNAVIDWIVLMSGVVLLGISVVMTVTAPSARITDDTMDLVEQMEDVLPA